MLGWLTKLMKPKRAPKRPDPQRARLEAARVAATRRIAASYDAAATNDDNRKHWANADALSPIGANTESVRKTIRERARYETANNSYLKGIVSTLSTTLVGKAGPRLQATTGDPELNKAIEAAWSIWAGEIRLASKLRTLKTAKTVDGEAFGVFRSNEALRTSVKLDLSLVEADQVTTPDITYWNNPYHVDGLRLDDYGNVVEYHVLRYHPGDAWRGFTLEYDRFPADRVVQWFRTDRPGQLRGISELSPALHLFGQMRRFTLATLTAAETAAMFAAVLTTPMPVGSDESEELPEYWSQQEIVKGMMTSLPEGFDMKQFAAEHPGTSMEMFIKLLLREACRCLCLPWNIAAGDSSSFNFSSARLDHLIFRDAVEVERVDCEREVLDPLFSEWLEEASRIPKLLPQSIQAFLAGVPHRWHWPAWAILDPTTEAAADTERLTNGTATLADVCAAQGKDWQEVIRQQEIEKAYRAKLQKELGTGQQQEEPQPVFASADIDACGGKGGKPGPCPTGVKEQPKTGRAAPKAKALMEGHPLAGKSKKEIVDMIRPGKDSLVGPTVTKPDPWGFRKREVSPEIQDAAYEAVVMHPKMKGLARPNVKEVVESVREKIPGASLLDVQTALAKDSRLTLGPFTQAPATMKDIEYGMPLDREMKFYVDVKSDQAGGGTAARTAAREAVEKKAASKSSTEPAGKEAAKPAPKAKAPAKPKKPADVKVKAASDKVAKINAKVTKAKEKLDGLKSELKTAKADLAALKKAAPKKIGERSIANKEKAANIAKDLESYAAAQVKTILKDSSKAPSVEQLKKVLSDKLGKASPIEVHKALGYGRPKNRASALAFIENDFINRVGAAQRVQV